MESQYMIMGQAAGVAAKLAVQKRLVVQDVPIRTMQLMLHQTGAVLHLSEASHLATSNH
jgi:PBP1b-binding outer membrane lipoprotein LpoB